MTSVAEILRRAMMRAGAAPAVRCAPRPGRTSVSRRTPGVFWAYLLLQVPDTLLAGLILVALYRWAGLSLGWAVGAFVVWIVKDIAMYPSGAQRLRPLADRGGGVHRRPRRS